MLPADSLAAVAEGVAALRIVGARLRAEAGARNDVSELWLAVRDVEGLAGRLADMDQTEWESGVASFWTNSQDVAVLSELAEGDLTLLSGRSFPASSPDLRERLTRLRDLLARYQPGGQSPRARRPNVRWSSRAVFGSSLRSHLFDPPAGEL
jgi:hypothetical protein